jgi:hypothetical protein
MSLETAIAELESGQSHQEMLDQLRARTVTKYGMAAGAEISGVLLSVGLLSLVEDQKNAVGEHTPLRNMCIALEKRFGPDGQVDLSVASNVAVLDEFLADATVAAMLAAQSINPDVVKAAIMQIGQTVELEFPNIRMVDVVNIRGAE